jgi:N-acetylmuramoyl-L-alanine amidase
MSYVFKVQHIPIDGDNRPGIKAEKYSLTVHNTGNTASDENESKNLGRADNYEEVGFNFVCDADSVTEVIPDNELTYHCGNYTGNHHSVALEVSELPGSEDVAIEFIADYLIKKDWGIDKVTTHNYWNGKNCPRLILPHWNSFIDKIVKTMQAKKAKEAKKMKNLVVYGKKEDKAAAELLAYKLKCPVMDADIPFDYSAIENVYPVGAPGNLPFTSYAKQIIAGTDQADTIKKVLEFKEA